MKEEGGLKIAFPIIMKYNGEEMEIGKAGEKDSGEQWV